MRSSLANVGNHLHLHVKITNRMLYKAWIRGLTSAIAMMIAGRDGLLNLKDYIDINHFEGLGIPRAQATVLIKGSRSYFKNSG